MLVTVRICLLSILIASGASGLRANVSQTAAEAAGETRIEFVAADGATLRAAYASPGKPGPGMILLHQCDMDRRAWDSLSGALAASGVHVIAADYRGVGENRGLPADYSQRVADVEAAFAALTSRRGVDPNRIAVGGASCGVAHAVEFARRNGHVKALALLSGPASDAGLAYIQEHNLPVFFAYSADEGGPLPGTRLALQSSTNPATTVKVYNQAGHGVRMFAAQPTLQADLVAWVVGVLK